MAELPSVFDRIDFISTLLPGYVPIVVYIFLFRTSLLFSDKPLYSDLFSSVVFLVAGPAIGLLLHGFHRGLHALYFRARYTRCKKRAGRLEFLEEYANVKIKMTDSERLELREAIALYDFNLLHGHRFACAFSAGLFETGSRGGATRIIGGFPSASIWRLHSVQ